MGAFKRSGTGIWSGNRLFFLAAVVLLFCVQPVWGANAGFVEGVAIVETDLAAESGGMAKFASDDFFQPSKVTFMLNGRRAKVGLQSLMLEGVPIYSASFEKFQEGDRLFLDTVLTSGGDRQVRLKSSVYKGWPGMRFSLTGHDESFRGMDMMVYGLDRLVYEEQDKYSVVPLGNSCGLRVQGEHIVLQNTVTQEGIIITAPAGAWFELRYCRQGFMVRAYQGVDYSPEGAFTVDVEAFQGDALIAMGTAGRRGAAFCGNKSYWEEPKPIEEPSAVPGDWEWFHDRGRVFKPLMADPKEARVRFGFMWDRNMEVLEDVVLGGDLGFLYKRFSKDDQFSITGRGVFTARFDMFSDSFDHRNSDYIGGLAFGYQHIDDTFELFVYHQSSHLGDEILERGDAQRIDYSRETARFLWAHNWGPLRIYAGPSFNLHALPKDIQHCFTLQTGAEYYFPLLEEQMYTAMDIQSRQEHDWNLNATFQLGWFLGDASQTRNRQWVFAEYFTGYSNMGQFWDEWENYGLIGAAYQWW